MQKKPIPWCGMYDPAEWRISIKLETSQREFERAIREINRAAQKGKTITRRTWSRPTLEEDFY